MEPLEEYHSPFDFEQGVNTSYLYLSPAYNDTPPSSPAMKSRGMQHHLDAVPEVGVDAMAAVATSSIGMTDEEQQELHRELLKVEDEIQTLSHVLAAKEKQLAEIKKKLGITPFNELKHNISRTWQEVTTSNAYRKTSETLTTASQKATAAFSTVGSAISRKLDDVRNAPTFKSFEERMETLKTKISPSTSSNEPSEQELSGPTNEPPLSPPEALPKDGGP